MAHQRPLPPQLSRCWATAGNALQGVSVRYGPLLANRWNSPRLEEALPEANPIAQLMS